jgi:hypothetical protein
VSQAQTDDMQLSRLSYFEDVLPREFEAIWAGGWIAATAVSLATVLLLARVSTLVYPTLDAYANVGSVVTDAVFRPFAATPRLLGLPFVLPSTLAASLSFALLGWALGRSTVRNRRKPTAMGAWPSGAATATVQATFVLAALDVSPRRGARVAKYLGVASITDLGWSHIVLAKHCSPCSTAAILSASAIAALPLGRILRVRRYEIAGKVRRGCLTWESFSARGAPQELRGLGIEVGRLFRTDSGSPIPVT